MKAHYRIASIDHPVWRNLLFKLFDDDVVTRETGYKTLRRLLDETVQPDNQLWVTPEEGAKIVAISMQQPFPKLKEVRQKPAQEILDWFLCLSHPLIAQTIHNSYASSTTDIQSSALIFLASQKDQSSYYLLAEIVSKHGLPPASLDKFFENLLLTPEHGGALIHSLILSSGNHIEEVLQYSQHLVSNGYISKEYLAPILPKLNEQVEILLKATLSLEEFEDRRLMRNPENIKLKAELCHWLRLLACLPHISPTITALGCKLKDPLLLLALTESILIQGQQPSAQLLEKAAGSHQIRSQFYELLQKLQRLDLFPRKHQNFEDFAAADMATWLAQPMALGYEPESLVFMAKLIGDKANQSGQWLLWKFTAEGENFAAISGPYAKNQAAEPTRGEDTFSCFNPWQEASIEQHFDVIIQSVFSWSIEAA